MIYLVMFVMIISLIIYFIVTFSKFVFTMEKKKMFDANYAHQTWRRTTLSNGLAGILLGSLMFSKEDVFLSIFAIFMWLAIFALITDRIVTNNQYLRQKMT